MTAPAGLRSLLVLGGARSGKSSFAQALAEATALDPVLVATATAGDAEMAERIARHRAGRGPRWRTVEAPTALAEAIAREARPGRIVVVDCLTLWLSNLMADEAPAGVEPAPGEDGLALAVAAAAGPVVLVSNEVGLGLVPMTPLGRAFRDRQGRLNQRMAGVCHGAVFVAAGLPLVLKPAGGPLPPLG